MQLKHLLRNRFPHLDPSRLPGGFDQVGDIAVVSIVPELAPFAPEIGVLLLSLHKTVRVVAQRDGEHGGEFRTRPIRVIAGEERLATVHRENGVILHLDLDQVYFSGRLAHERARIASLVSPGERVAVLGSGAGPFPLIIGRHSLAGEITGIEWNPVAHEYALKNLLANRGVSTVRFLKGEAGEVLTGLGTSFDRILIALPHGGETLLPAALTSLRPGGTLHFYAMQAKGCHRAAVALIETACHHCRLQTHLLQVAVCGHCGPAVHRICLDVVIESSK